MNIKKLFLYMGAILTLSLVTMCVTTVNDNAGKEETVICRGQEVHTSGPMVKVGQQAPDFRATNADLQDVSLSSFKGKRIILNIFPSLDTPTCALSVRQFNARASELENTVVLCLSMDLPFAQSRFCSTEGLNNVVPLSVFRSHDFLKEYGLQLADGPLKGLMARAVVVIDETGKVCYTQLVSNISNEPDYDAALRAANAL
ncbi:probable thiol peroxidase 2 [Bacteroides sp. CAG:443]|nr:probable thiol peroxidase 2 [Bacteroides sp. CAG:443]